MYVCLNIQSEKGPRPRVDQWVGSLDLTTHTRLSPIRRGFAHGFVNYKKGCIRLAAASDKVYQLLAHGRWFSPGTPASSTTKTGRHDIAEILLKVALKHQKSNQTKVKRGRVAQWISSLDLTTHTSLSPIRRRFAPAFVN
jgi:hypothetical protein